jgi:hypothetical protein
MKYLKLYELFNSNIYTFDTIPKRYGGVESYFTSDNQWEYQVTITPSDYYDDAFFFGFKARKEDSFESFDHDVLTNDNIFKVMSTIKQILLSHYTKHEPRTYVFSTSSSDQKLAVKRAKVYLMMLAGVPEWRIEKDPEMNRWFIHTR